MQNTKILANRFCTLQAVNEASTQAALACHGSELGIWDLQQQQQSYHAKGGKPNKLRLVDKPHNTALAFLPDSNSQRVVVGTAYHKLRVYDIKSRRPALEMEFGEARITAVAPESNGKPYDSHLWCDCTLAWCLVYDTSCIWDIVS